MLPEFGLYYVVPELLLSSPVNIWENTYLFSFIPFIKGNRMIPHVVVWVILAMTWKTQTIIPIITKSEIGMFLSA